MPPRRPRTPAPTPVDEARGLRWAQHGDALTSANGVPIDDTDNSLRAGARGPTLLDDFHLREKVMHFDHERIPERVVHARGAGAHGRFELYESLEELTCASVLCDTSKATPVFVRFSTVAGSRGSADTARDVRGFATKFYTDEGIWDLVGNNMPVFFIQDGIKFPDLIHAAKPEPNREIPQAQTAHDTFWDFASLAPESTHMLLWIMSDRAIPRSYRMMDGFGVHTFRLVNASGATSLVKFHWRPAAGVHSLLWEEAQLLAGFDPDFHRRDLFEAIESGAFPTYELGVQIFPDTEDQMFEGIDLLDPTKLVPEELAPVRLVGRMTLDRNPTNYFAETEQVAFCTAHVPRGIDFTDDPLLQARNFSYLDTQLTRLGGPNFDQLPINRPTNAVNTNERDGYGQHAVHEGLAAYTPNSVGGGCPFSPTELSYVHVPRTVGGPRVRERAVSFSDHFSQATMFWNSMTPIEQDHIVAAFAFELSKCSGREIQERMLNNLASVHGDLADAVASMIGRPAPESSPTGTVSSPALAQIGRDPGDPSGRVLGVLVGASTEGAGIAQLRRRLAVSRITVQLIAQHGGQLGELPIDKALFSSRAVEFDAIAVADGTAELSANPFLGTLLSETYRHLKPIVAWGDGAGVLKAAGIDSIEPGVLTSAKITARAIDAMASAMRQHRVWGRNPDARVP